MVESQQFDLNDYYSALSSFDKAVCEACAVSNFTADLVVANYIGHSSHVFTRLCVHSEALISSLPKSRWAKRDYESWDFSVIAAHVRAVMEGYLLFGYLAETPKSEDEWYVKLNIMHLNDCTRRIRLHANIKNSVDEQQFRLQQDELKQRLKVNGYFDSLSAQLKKNLLKGRALMIPTREELLSQLGENVGDFNAFYDAVSNYTHILPMSYYRMDSNGRGTGAYNHSDLSYIIVSLNKCTNWLVSSTDRMIEFFPNSKGVRKGKKSKFTLGPKENTRNRK
ncbi:DUF5677 domain-containing protein [Vibrio cyclitrophicus]|uniref:DUF5677 domain-containing protein n=1 Tax=Vibrio cyclitrophicus TaxID=47951 RepID=UPI000C856744|nr:DUF5677 domain-containing protein [Vibrio cyclitrophicus]PME93841.1 hypothetical protein BCV26_09920 [Vibrio cyclitrophicus]PMJ94492.1 hypothetical protein BCU11_04795 [Vibrio cyclitrophicus]